MIISGHLIFEMSCGYELTQLRPGEDDYKNVKDLDVKGILQYIFKEDFSNTIEQVKLILATKNSTICDCVMTFYSVFLLS